MHILYGFYDFFDFFVSWVFYVFLGYVMCYFFFLALLGSVCGFF